MLCIGALDPEQPDVCAEAELDEDSDRNANRRCERFTGQQHAAPRPCPNANDTANALPSRKSCMNAKWGACTCGRGPSSETRNGRDGDDFWWTTTTGAARR